MRSFHSGFSLLEVMVALAIMAISIMVFFQIEARSIYMAGEAKDIGIATNLAKAKLLDCRYEMLKRGFSTSDFQMSGDFSKEGFPDFSWDCLGYRFDVPVPSADQIAQGMKAQEGGTDNLLSAMSASVMAPFMGMVSQTLGDSVRELNAEIHWMRGKNAESLKLTTHVVDKTPMIQLATMLRAGIPGVPGSAGVLGTSPGASPGTPGATGAPGNSAPNASNSTAPNAGTGQANAPNQ